MYNLSNKELSNIYGGSINSTLKFIYKIYRIIKIRLLMKKLFID